mmetsp:Transcript_3350/g.7137  ORF Transcript_3350/g.7137 Transcript_3350/m.7137 type:complete len:227 (+) Transcript_3350:1386-2066(+)
MREEEIEKSRDVLTEGVFDVFRHDKARAQEDGSFAAGFWNVLVLAHLGVSEVVVLHELRLLVAAVDNLRVGLDGSDATPCNVPEANVETLEVVCHDEEETEGNLEVELADDAGGETEGDVGLGELVEVGLEDGGVEAEEDGQHRQVLVVERHLCDEVVELRVNAGGVFGVGGGDGGEVLEQLFDDVGVLGDDVRHKVLGDVLMSHEATQRQHTLLMHRVSLELVEE